MRGEGGPLPGTQAPSLIIKQKETFSSFGLHVGVAHCGFNLNFLMTKEVDYLFICLLAFGFPLCKMAVQVLCPLKNIGLSEFIRLISETSLYNLDMSALLVLGVVPFFSCSVTSLFLCLSI